MSARSTILSVLITGDAKGLKKVFKDTGTDADEFGGKMGGLGKIAAVAGTAFAGLGLISVGKDMQAAGAELKIMGDKAQVVFGDQLPMMQKWAAENNRALGLSKQATLDLATSTSDLLIPLGFTREEAAKQSSEMVGAAGALSAWSKGKVTSAGASEILNKALLGETDGLVALGIKISDNDVQTKLLANGQDKLTGTALAQAKALVIQELIMEKSTDAQTAWNDGTMDGVKAQNELKAKGEEVKASLATSLQPAFELLTKAMLGGTVVVEKLTKFFGDHKVIVVGVAGAIVALTGAIIVHNIQLALATEGTMLHTASSIIGATATGALSAAQWLLNAAMSANPIMLVVLAVAALAGGLYLAYEKVGWFHDAVDKAWQILQTGFDWLSNNWPLVLAILTGPIGLAVLYITTHFDEIVEFFKKMPGRITGVVGGMFDGIKDAFRATLNWIIGGWNSLDFQMPEVDTHIPGVGKIGGWTMGLPDIPLLAAGAIATGPTLAMIGEGTRDEAVVPLPTNWRSGGGLGGGTTIVNNIYIKATAPTTAGREVTKALNVYARSGGRS